MARRLPIARAAPSARIRATVSARPATVVGSLRPRRKAASRWCVRTCCWIAPVGACGVAGSKFGRRHARRPVRVPATTAAPSTMTITTMFLLSVGVLPPSDEGKPTLLPEPRQGRGRASRMPERDRHARCTLLVPREGRPPIGGRAGIEHPIRTAVIVTVLGYAVLTVLMLAVGLLLTHTLSSSVGRWDESLNRWLAARRTRSLDDLTGAATVAVNTLPVIVTAAVCDSLLGWRRRWREAAFLTLALLLEVTVFLSVTFVVARPRPDVVRLNTTPATSSFPSGHTAAATVVFAGLAIIVFCSTTRKTFRVLGVVAAVIFPALVGFSRVYRGLHHPTDVFVGVIFGLACLAIAALAVRAASVRAERHTEREWSIASTSPRAVGLEHPRIAR